MMLLLVGTLLVLVYTVSKSHDYNQCNCINDNVTLNCYKCSGSVEEDYIYCPHCKEKLKRECVSCGCMINVTWRQCPYCE